MKISQEVRDFAKLNLPLNGKGDFVEHRGGAGADLADTDAEAAQVIQKTQ